MKALAIGYSIAIAIVLTVALAPTSSWILKNSWDLLRAGGWHDPEITDVRFRFAPSWISQPETYSGKSAPEELMHGLMLTGIARVQALHDFAESHPKEGLGWAVAARMACTFNLPAPDERAAESTKTMDREAQTSYGLGLDACEQGERTEPDNAFFPLLRAALDMESGRLAGMSAALRSAAAKRVYNDHYIDEANYMKQAQISAKGYRGELVSDFVAASVDIPEMVHIRHLARFLNRAGSLEDKRNMIQVAFVMGEGVSTAYPVLIADASAKFVLSPPADYNRQIKDASGHLPELIGSFEVKLAKSRIPDTQPPVAEVVNKLDRLTKACATYLESMRATYPVGETGNQSVSATLFETLAPTALLVSLVLSVVLSLAIWMFASIKAETGRQILPHLLALPMWLLFLVWFGDVPLVSNGLFLILLQTLLFPLYLPKKPAALCGTIGLLAAAWVAILITFSSQVSTFAAALVATALVLALMEWFLPPDTRAIIAAWGGIGVAAASIAFGAGNSAEGAAFLAGFAYVFVRLALHCRPSSQPAKWSNLVAVAFVPLILVGAGSFLFWRLFQTPGFVMPLLGSLLIILPGGAAFMNRQSRVAILGASVGTISMSVLFLFAVGLDLRANHEASLSSPALQNESAAIHRIAGIGPR